MGKGDMYRPSTTSREERDLRWSLATGLITFAMFEQKYRELAKRGLIHRSGRKVE